MKHIAALLLTLAACTGDRNPFLPRNEPVPEDIARACDLTRTRCSQCHTLDHVLATHASLDEWRELVHRMRLMRGSAIRHDEEPVIISCLSYRLDAARKSP